MDTLEGKIQALITGAACEEQGCAEEARWYVSRADESFHWCTMHTVLCMAEKDFWKQGTAILAHVPQ